MSKSFRDHHLFSLLSDWEQTKRPLSRFVNEYFRNHKAIGSKDRTYISKHIYALIKWKRLLDHLSDDNSWESRLSTFQSEAFLNAQTDSSIPTPVRLSCPDSLYDLVSESYNPEITDKLCLAMNTQAPVTIRVNPEKTSREELLSTLIEKGFVAHPTIQSPYGITFEKRHALFALPEYQMGLFEMQDEGSQLVANLVDAKPGQKILDFCAGSGGKTLAFAHKLQGKGQIYLHDIRKTPLLEAKQRLKRAGVQNAQIIHPNSTHLNQLKKKMDWVLVDAPCSGTGAFRRNSDMKWTFSKTSLKKIIGDQRKIFEKALTFLRPGGQIVYATCSILKEENEKQLNHFIKAYSLEAQKDPFSSLPFEGELDRFFAAVLKK